MWKNETGEAEEFCEKLSSARNFAGAIIGDNWVAAFMVHLDCMGPIYTMRWRREPVSVPKGVCPSLAAVKASLGTCWRELGNDVKVEYSRFFLCVPGWQCRSISAKSELEIIGRWPGRKNGRLRVEERHVRKLERAIKTTNLPPDSEVVDYVRGSFILDDGRLMVDPVGAATRKLGLTAHLVVADGFWVNDILRFLAEQGVKVDGMTSTFGATANLLADEEMLDDTVVVDIGARNTYLSFYSEGMLAATRTVGGGTDDVISRVAGDLGLPISEVVASVAQLKLLLLGGTEDRGGECPLFVWRTKLPAVRDLDNAVIPFADSLLHNISLEIEKLGEEQGMRVRNAVVLGDDPLVVRGLLSLLKEKTHLRGRRGVPENIHKNEDSESPGYAHMVSMVRHHGSRRVSHDENGTNVLVASGDSMVNSCLKNAGAAMVSYFGKVKDSGGAAQRRLVLRPTFPTSGELLQTFEGSKYVSGT